MLYGYKIVMYIRDMNIYKIIISETSRSHYRSYYVDQSDWAKGMFQRTEKEGKVERKEEICRSSKARDKMIYATETRSQKKKCLWWNEDLYETRTSSN